MRILVTGNLGYVGSHLTNILIDAGHEVIGCDLSLYPDAVCEKMSVPAFQYSRDFRSLRVEELVGIDAIAHLAGLSNDPTGELNSGLTLEINGQGSVNLARKARDAGVAIFAFASSCSIYGSAGQSARVETDDTNPLSEYAISKLFAEKGISNLANSEFRVYLLRNATAFGASPVLRTDLVVNDLASGMHVSEIAEIRSDGTPWRPLINCRDMARAFQLFIENNPNSVSGIPINIGFERENFQVKEVGVRIQKAWPNGRLIYVPGATADPRDYKVSFQKLKSIFPFLNLNTLLKREFWKLNLN